MKAVTISLIVATTIFTLYSYTFLTYINGQEVKWVPPCEPAGSPDVSGFYGPGALVAWAITLSISLIRTEARMIRDLLFRKQSETEVKIDGELLASVAFSSVASFDLLARSTKREIGLQVTAPLFINIISLLIASYALILQYFQRISLGPGPHTPTHPARGLLWMVFFLIFSVPLLYRETISDTVIKFDVLIWFLILYLVSLISCSIETFLSVRSRAFAFACYCTVVMSMFPSICAAAALRLLHKSESGVFCHSLEKFELPTTSSRFTELDQAAAVGIAIGQIVIPWIKKGIQEAKSHYTHTHESAESLLP